MQELREKRRVVPFVRIIGRETQQNSEDSEPKTQQKPVESAARNMLSIQPL
jgi:ribose 1,5-bisphosphokinase PhnN